jgi:hypothetical protein
MDKPWYEVNREKEYEALYHYCGVETVEDEYNQQYRDALNNSLSAKLIELRYKLHKFLAPAIEKLRGG